MKRFSHWKPPPIDYSTYINAPVNLKTLSLFDVPHQFNLGHNFRLPQLKLLGGRSFVSHLLLFHIQIVWSHEVKKKKKKAYVSNKTYYFQPKSHQHLDDRTNPPSEFQANDLIIIFNTN